MVWLAWLAVKEGLTVAEKEGQLAVAEADSVPLCVGDCEAVEPDEGVFKAEEDADPEDHGVELEEAEVVWVALPVWLP